MDMDMDMDMDNVEREFEAIADRALQDAARVKASVAEYQNGLRTVIELVATALRASKERDKDS